ncbi:uncharacterized protein LOC131030448 [Cryptomeria japonica]|uniref:uncharacterized protein LOC131030448 n=1 Tax=Cryptomeria japonica TaxID=3369 RepID=UPI0025AB7322|nr:uncharacterized protein LOC131030448 [Cryptomeria japonica]
MVKVITFAAMTVGAFIFWQTMDKAHVWMALHQDEKREKELQEMEIVRTRQKLLRELKEKESTV